MNRSDDKLKMLFDAMPRERMSGQLHKAILQRAQAQKSRRSNVSEIIAALTGGLFIVSIAVLLIWYYEIPVNLPKLEIGKYFALIGDMNFDGIYIIITTSASALILLIADTLTSRKRNIEKINKAMHH